MQPVVRVRFRMIGWGRATLIYSKGRSLVARNR